MIILKQMNEKWRIIIGDEVWEFPSLEVMKNTLNIILDFKNTYGQIKFNERRI